MSTHKLLTKPNGFRHGCSYTVLRAAEVPVVGLIGHGNRVARWSRIVVLPLVSLGPPFLAWFACVLLGLLPASVAEPKIEEMPPHSVTANYAGSLVIVGGGGLPDVIRDRFLKLAGGKKGRLVVIPTASEEADDTRIDRIYSYWERMGFGSVKMLHTRNPKRANDPSFVKPLTEATAAWMSGGDQSRLANAYRGTAVEKELSRLLARGGVIGGTSAGASVMSSIMITDGNPKARVSTGFSLLPDVVIDQHFQNRKRKDRLLGVLEQHRNCLGMGIDEETAVVVRGHRFTVVGKANVSICRPPSEQDQEPIQVLKSGEGGDLLQLSHRMRTRPNAPAESSPIASETARASTR
jgi:cyanophycinase